MPRRHVSMSRAETLAFLAVPRTAVLATIGRDGVPHLTGMWFVVCDDEVQMWTYRKSQKVTNLRRDPSCSVLIETGGSYGELMGVMVRGRARMIDRVSEVVSIGRLLYERYTLPHTAVAYDQGPHIEIERQASKRIGLALPLERVVSWDHTKLGTP